MRIYRHISLPFFLQAWAAAEAGHLRAICAAALRRAKRTPYARLAEMQLLKDIIRHKLGLEFGLEERMVL